MKATKICTPLTRGSQGDAHAILVMHHPAYCPHHPLLTQTPTHEQRAARSLAQPDLVGLRKGRREKHKEKRSPPIFRLHFLLFLNEDCDLQLYLSHSPLLSDSLRIWVDTKCSRKIYERKLSPKATSREHTGPRTARGTARSTYS